MPKAHSPCGVTLGCFQLGDWQAGVVVVWFTNTPPSEDMIRGHASSLIGGAAGHSLRQSLDSCTHCCRVSPPGLPTVFMQKSSSFLHPSWQVVSFLVPGKGSKAMSPMS